MLAEGEVEELHQRRRLRERAEAVRQRRGNGVLDGGIFGFDGAEMRLGGEEHAVVADDEDLAVRVAETRERDAFLELDA